MKFYISILAFLFISCSSPQLPPQNSYSISETYRKCDQIGHCKVVSIKEKQ